MEGEVGRKRTVKAEERRWQQGKKEKEKDQESEEEMKNKEKRKQSEDIIIISNDVAFWRNLYLSHNFIQILNFASRCSVLDNYKPNLRVTDL